MYWKISCLSIELCAIVSAKVHADLPAYHACKVVEIRPEKISAKSDLHQKKSDEERLAMAKYLKAGQVPKGIETIKAFGLDPAEI